MHDYGGEGWQVLAASPCVLAKLRNVFRWHIVVKAPPSANISSVLLPFFRFRKTSPAINVAADVDPSSLL